MNISQEKREKMLMLLSKIKEENKEDKNVVIALNEIENEIKNMKYGLMWEEHEEEVDKELEHSIPIFSEEKDKEILVDEKGKYNFLLEGDNLHSLKLLQRTHKEKIDIIYIDPPYNTKNKDFIYDDNMIGEDDGYRHSKWLSFMQRRLEIAKDLLTDDGVIFISIDDNEQAQLKLLCDNIFGENNFRSIIWKKKGGAGNTEKILGGVTEFIHCYFKNKKPGVLNYREIERNYKYKDSKGRYNIEGIEKTNQGVYARPTMLFEIEDPKTGIKYRPGKNKRWTIGEKNIKKLIEEGKILFDSKKMKVYRIKREEDYAKSKNLYYNLLLEYGSLSSAKDELKEILGEREIFDTPKPTALIKHLITMASNKDSIILDFFAGSGTTGHALAKLNAEDGGNRTYILCTNNENNICEEVTYKRLLGIQKELPHNLKYFKTDFLEKSDEELLYDLMEHMNEMVILENGYSKESKKYAVILTDEDMDELEENISEYTNLERIYMSNEVLLTSKQNNILSNYEIKYIPQYYFDNELKEMGEFW